MTLSGIESWGWDGARLKPSTEGGGGVTSVRVPIAHVPNFHDLNYFLAGFLPIGNEYRQNSEENRLFVGILARVIAFRGKNPDF